MDFNFKELLDNLILSQIEDKKAVAALKVLKKHGFSVNDGIALLMELSVAVDAIENKEQD